MDHEDDPRSSLGGICAPPAEAFEYKTSDSGAWLYQFTLYTFLPFKKGPRWRDRWYRTAIKSVATRCGMDPSTADHALKRLAKRGAVERDPADPQRFRFLLPPAGAGLSSPGSQLTREAPTAPPRWVLDLPVDASVKRLLIGICSFADRESSRSPESITVKKTMEELAQATGQTWRAVRDQIIAARELGIVIRKGRSLTVVGRESLAVDRLRRPEQYESDAVFRSPEPGAGLFRGEKVTPCSDWFPGKVTPCSGASGSKVTPCSDESDAVFRHSYILNHSARAVAVVGLADTSADTSQETRGPDGSERRFGECEGRTPGAASRASGATHPGRLERETGRNPSEARESSGPAQAHHDDYWPAGNLAVVELPRQGWRRVDNR